MKKLFLILLTFMSLTTFAQMQVKEGSFRHVPNAVMEDKMNDANELSMALIKISTENINEAERMRLSFRSNRATQIIKKN